MAVQLATDADFARIVKDNDRVVVKYFADWCGACKMFAPKYRRVSNEEENSGVVFLEVNAEHSPAARQAAGVDNLPFLASFKGGALAEGSAASKEDYLRKLIDLTA
jgi:thiol-disulfide isomerase/thioredoxin